MIYYDDKWFMITFDDLVWIDGYLSAVLMILQVLRDYVHFVFKK
jgi:hypothetical protein